VEAAIKDLAAPVKHIGFLNQTQIPLAYAVGDALILTSDGTETWGLVVNEAMTCGLPAVVSDKVGCAADLVTDEETGFVYPCGDVAALAAQMLRLAGDPTLRARLADAARRRVQSYSIQAAADGLCRAIASVSGHHLTR
jgi:glycosyltransferase involved in cell wall biosynthesis